MSRLLVASAATLLAGGAAFGTAPFRPASARSGPVPSVAARVGVQDTTRPHVVGPNDSTTGAYLTVVGGCNDCHTTSWDQTMGKTPDADRLTGSPVGYRGPWGTTYAANLRLVASRAPEDRWVQILTTADGGHGRPPMPWQNTAQMSDGDLRAMYRYLKALGPKGERMPRAVPPGQEPTTPAVLMVPQPPKKGR